jgi:tRNA-dihydrouridine synthase C
VSASSPGHRARIAPRPDAEGTFIALAPMDGVTDHVYRELLTGLGGGDSGISQCVSEFVRVTHDVVPDRVIRRHCPEVDRGGRTSSGVPVFVQILGGDEGPMADTAAAAAALGAPGIDINFGCPAKTVNNHDGGATILKTPCRVERIVSAVRRAVPSATPVSVKIRLGWDSADDVEEIARAAEAGGGSWLTIHARTRLQLYKPPVDWRAIGRARDAVSFPVVANGDLNTVADVDACARLSGCNAFMIGRGAMARPLLFRQLRGHVEPDLDLPWLIELLADYTVRLQEAGATDHAALGRLKQWLRLAAPAFEPLREFFDTVKRLSDLEQARARLRATGTEGRPTPGRLHPGSTRSPAVSPAP